MSFYSAKNLRKHRSFSLGELMLFRVLCMSDLILQFCLLLRAVFDSAQLLLSWFSTLKAHNTPSSYVTIQEQYNRPWILLGNLADQATSNSWTIPINAHQEYPIASYESFVARSACYIKISGFTVGANPQADSAR